MVRDLPHTTGVPSSSRSSSAVAGVGGQPPERGLHQLGDRAQPTVAGGLGQQPGEQMPDPGGRGPQPVALVVVAQQDLATAKQISSASVTAG